MALDESKNPLNLMQNSIPFSRGRFHIHPIFQGLPKVRVVWAQESS